MKVETSFLRPSADAGVTHRAVIVVAGTTIVVLLALYWPTAYSIYAIWRRSDTFAHGFLIVPAVVWLLWRDRSRLRLIPVRPSFSILAAVAVAGFVWMAARLAAVSVASQFAFLLMLEFSVVTNCARSPLTGRARKLCW